MNIKNLKLLFFCSCLLVLFQSNSIKLFAQDVKIKLLNENCYQISCGEFNVDVNRDGFAIKSLDEGIDIQSLKFNKVGEMNKIIKKEGSLIIINKYKIMIARDIAPEINEQIFKELQLQNIDILMTDAAFIGNYVGKEIIQNYIQPKAIIMAGSSQNDPELILFKRYKKIYPSIDYLYEPGKTWKSNFIITKREPFTKIALKEHVRKLSQDFYPRNYKEYDNLNKTADYIKREFELSGARVIEQPYIVRGHTYRNIIAQFGPDGAEKIIIGAHYDTYRNAPGADDNASGVAGIIEMAYFFGTIAQNLKKNIELVGYATEEPPYYTSKPGKLTMGSDVHSKMLKDNNIDVAFMISLDQIGYFSYKEGSQRFPFPGLEEKAGSDKGDFIGLFSYNKYEKIVQALENGMKSGTQLAIHSWVSSEDSIRSVIPSDCNNYWLRGFPAVLITDTAPYRGDHRHSKRDKEKIMRYSQMRSVVGGLAYTIYKIANQ